MVYYDDGTITIRDMKKEDAKLIHSERLSLGWHSDGKVYKRYLREQESKSRYVFIAEYDGRIAGYATLRSQATSGPFADKGIPELVDFNVFTGYRRKGIGSKILDCAEKMASAWSETISFGVGLHSGYGSAQRLYVKRGYIPDGSGVWYKDRNLQPYEACRNDDDLILYFSKEL